MNLKSMEWYSTERVGAINVLVMAAAFWSPSQQSVTASVINLQAQLHDYIPQLHALRLG